MVLLFYLFTLFLVINSNYTPIILTEKIPFIYYLHEGKSEVIFQFYNYQEKNVNSVSFHITLLYGKFISYASTLEPYPSSNSY